MIDETAWPSGPIKSSPDVIIGALSNRHFLNGLSLVVSWGTMWRQPQSIWGTKSLTAIQSILSNAADSIAETGSVGDAWALLTGGGQSQLAWSQVLTSKFLHFLCRSLGFEQNPPVAIDNAIILQKVWPEFAKSIPTSAKSMKWSGSWDAYARYMTAIEVWASRKGWTTTDLEATLFSAFND